MSDDSVVGSLQKLQVDLNVGQKYLDSKVHGAYMGPTWGR